MMIEVDEKLSYKDALLTFKHEWVTKQLDGGTVTATAKRVGLSRKGLQLLSKGSMEITGAVQQEMLRCLFCGTTDKLHLHHVDGKNHSPKVEALCESCHKIFHSLNTRYGK